MVNRQCRSVYFLSAIILLLVLHSCLAGISKLRPASDTIRAMADPPAGLSISDVKELPDDSVVQLDSKLVVYAPRDILLTRSTAHFYIEEPNRSAAIRVVDSSTSIDDVKTDYAVSLYGVMKTSETTGERYIVLTAVPTIGLPQTAKAIGVTTKSIHSDDKVLGELVRVAGKVREVSANRTWFTIADGYASDGTEVRTRVIVEDKLAVGAISVGEMITVTGVVALDGASPATASRVILVRTTPNAITLPKPLISVNAATLPSGSLTTWANVGSLAGSFGNDGTTPTVGIVDSRRCVTFDGADWMKSSFTAPAGITGNGDFTYSAWLYNPAFGAHETVMSWSRRSAGTGTNAEMIFGNDPSYGAVSHWSSGTDMGFDGGQPSAGAWHHIAVTFNGSVEKVYVDGVLNAQESKTLGILPNLLVYLGCAYSVSGTTYTPGYYYSGSIASIQMYDSALSDQYITLLYGGQVAYAIKGTVKNQAGTGIQGAQVYFSKTPNASTNPVYVATTDATGNYSQPVGDGTWYATTFASGYRAPVERSVVVNGANVTGIDFSLTAIPTYAISGRVTDQNGAAVSGAKVYLKTSPNASVSPNYTLTVDSSGNYSQAVVDGTWYVAASATGYTSPAERSVVVSGAAVPGIDFTLNIIPTFTVSGQITNASAVGVSGAKVYFGAAANPSVNPVYTATADISGNYSQLVPNGTWYVAAGATSYNTSADRIITVNGANLPNTNFTLDTQGVPGIKTGPYLQAMTPNSVYVLVESGTADPVMVEWGERNDYGEKCYTESMETTTSVPTTYVHNIKISGLQPNRSYHYRVSQSGGTPSSDYSFTTAVNPGTPYRFAMTADFKGGTTVHDAISALVLAAKPIFSLYGGDLCNTSDSDTLRREFFRGPELALDAVIPFFNSPGNHETWSTSAKAFTQGPASGSGTQDYYSFDWGDVHFVCLNNMISYGVGSAQYNWIANDLAASNKPWKIVWCHYPAYCSGGHGEDPTMIAVTNNLFVPNHVDMVLCGHSHFYQHNLVNGIHHMIVGSAGAGLYDPTNASYTIMSSKSYCYAILDMTPTTLKYVAYNDSGAVLETLNLTKQFVVSGQVRTSGGQPIYNAVVAAGGASSNVTPVVTDSSGNYSLSLPGPGTYEIYADGPGYSASFGNVTVSASGTVTNNITLASAPEDGVYNGSFETASGGLPDGWETFTEKPGNGVDYFGNAWPDKPDMYSFGRSTLGNTTPGGSVSALVATASPLANYGILRWDRFRVSGDACTGITENTLTDSARAWTTNYWYAGGTGYVQIVHGGNDSGAVPTIAGDFKVVSNDATTVTVQAGSNLASAGYAAGDHYRFLVEVRNYWYTGGIRTASVRRIPVDHDHVYNFYFKQKTTYTGTESEKCHVYGLVWRDALGNEINRYEWRWRPSSTAFSQSTPRLFVAPPVGAATVEAVVYTTCVDNANRNWSDTSLIDDVVVDPVSVSTAGALQSLADGTHAVVAGDSVSLAPRDTAGERYTNYFYVSEPDGSAGIRIRNAGPKFDNLNVNEMLAVSGVVRTDAATGEKYLQSNINGTTVVGRGSTPTAATVGSVLSDADAVGKFVSVTAQVSSIAPDVSWFSLTDGANTIKVNSVGFPLVSGFAAVGNTIRVNGVVSKEGSNRVILMMNYTKQTTAWPTNDVTFFSLSDTHYGGGWATRLLHKQRIAAMNALPGTAYPSGVGGVVSECRGVTVSGDITDNDNDKAGQFAEFALDFGLSGQNQLRYPVYEGNGNHDGGINLPTAEAIIKRNPFRPDVTNISGDGWNYAWDWGKVHLVHTNEIGSYLSKDSLPWLANDLATNVGSSGRPVVLIAHEGFDGFSFAFSSRGEAKRLYDVIKNYNVIAIIWGHTGGYAQYKWGGIDVFGVDGMMEGFHVFHITPTELIVTRRQWSNNSWMPWTFRKTITGM